jgi:hypothetical protein
MHMTLKRQGCTAKSTPGTLHVEGEFECYTLEDVVRPEKVAGCTAIPAGTYHVMINQSARFKRPLPLLLDVPGFSGVRIHPGNTDKDTEGCILVGDSPSADFLGNSRVAFDRLFAKLKAEYDAGGRITLSIE